MSSGTGSGSGAKGVTGSAKKVVGFVLALFVVMMVAPNVDTLMATAESFGGTIAGLFSAVGNVLDQIEAAFQSASAAG